MFSDWLSLYKQIYDSQGKIESLVCPECGLRTVGHQYVGRESDRMGYLDIWCYTCNKGAHFSRVRIPENALFISFDDFNEDIIAHIPNYEHVE